MVDKVGVEFTGDATGVEQAGRETSQVISRVRQQLQDMQNPLAAMGRAWRDVFRINTSNTVNQINNVDKSIVKTKGDTDSLSKSLKTLATGAGLGLLVRQAQDMADSWTRSRNLLAAVGVEAQNLGATQDDLVRIAKETRTALEPTIFLYSRMYRAVAPLGVAQEEVARATEITNKAFKAGGAAVSEQNNAILQLSQALGSGLLQGDELRSVRENAPLVAQAIADEFDTTIAGLKKLGEQGELTTDRVFKGIINGGKDIDAQFATTLPTISDGFTNLQTALIAFIGKGNEASGVSMAIGTALAFIGNNLGTLTKLAVAGATAWGVYSIATALAARETGTLGAAQLVVSLRSAVAATAAALTSRSFYSMATAATVARGAMTLMLGPIGLAIAAGAALFALFGIMEGGADSMRNWGAEIASTQAKLGSLQASVQDWDDDQITRTGSAMEGMGQKTETAAEKVERLGDALERANTAQFQAELLKADEVVKETKEQIEALRVAYVNASKWKLNLFGQGERDEQLKGALQAAYDQIAEAERIKQELIAQGEEGRDREAQKRLNEAIIEEIEVRQFAARNNAALELEILREKTRAVKNIYGDESKEYMRAVKEKEAFEKKLASESERLARETAQAQRDAQKDILEQYDLRLEAAREDRDASLAIMEEKLAKLKEFYGEDSREYARGLQDKLRLEQRFARQAAREAAERIRGARDVEQAEAEAALADKKAELDRRRALVDQARALDEINDVEQLNAKAEINAQEVQLEINHENRLFQIKAQALRDFLALDGLRNDERARAMADLEKLEQDHINKIAAINAQAGIQVIEDQTATAQAVADSWDSMLAPVQSGLSGMFRDLYNGTAGWRDSFLKVLDGILFSFVDMGIKMVTQWAANQIAMTTAQTAGSAARTAAVTAEGGTATAISAGTALKQIMNYAYTAAAGAYSAMAGIPYIGPVLAVGASAAALAAVIGLAGKLFSAKGGFGKVPYDGAMTELHKDEMVLPAQYATPLRDMLSGARAPAGPGVVSGRAASTFNSYQASQQDNSKRGGDMHFNYSPVHQGQGSQSTDSMLRRDGRRLRKWFENEIRNGTIKV